MSEDGGEARGPSSSSSSLRHHVYQQDGNTALFFGHVFVVVTLGAHNIISGVNNCI